jgi:hypothetical protein
VNRSFCFILVLALGGCRSEDNKTDERCSPAARVGDVVLNEVVSNNEGVWVDRSGETDDWVEILNTSDRPIDLSEFSLADEKNVAQLPERTLEPGGRTLIWLDEEPEEGADHMPFKLSSGGEMLSLRSCDVVIDEVDVPPLPENETYARYPDGSDEWDLCRYTTPQAENGDHCKTPDPYGLVTGTTYEEYEWPEAYPSLKEPLAISELALLPANFIELVNTTGDRVSLSGYRFELAAISPGKPFPALGEGEPIDLGTAELRPGEHLALPVSTEQSRVLDDSPEFEGVATLFDAEGEVIDRIDFMRFPSGSSLARPEGRAGGPFFCEELTPNAPNDCTILASREIGDRVRGLRTLGDFAALAEGGSTLQTSAVKFIVDVVQDRAVHFLSSSRWPLHYTFIREVVEGNAPLDRCIPEENALFYDGWRRFSQEEYFVTTGRHYFLGTLVHHGATGHHTTEHTTGDEILASDIRDSFFTVTERILEPTEWAFRPQDEEQSEKAATINGQLPILPTNAPFADLTYQPLTHGIGYGVLTFVAAEDLERTPLGAQVLLVTDDVPNDIPLVGGLITQAFQTPLAHVNVLSQSRGTPNMALRNALEDPRISEHLGELVRLEVLGDGFSVEPADPEEAAAFWEGFTPSGPKQAPRLETGVTELVDLVDASLESLPLIGAKAAQMAELYRVRPLTGGACAEVIPFSVPEGAFAVPVAHFLRHYEESGAKAYLEEERERDNFATDPIHRADVLERVQNLMMRHPVEPVLLLTVIDQVNLRFQNRRVRFRSSSNAEDLPGFNGAGLYTSISAEIGDPERSVEDALRTVWASLFTPRAYDEREISRVDHDLVAMGVLVHEAFLKEAANGVGVSRNLADPNRGDIYYVNVQAGEASVTNPAPGVSTEAFTYRWTRPPTKTLLSVSNLTLGEPVMTETEELEVGCALAAVHSHFEPLIDPEDEDPWFAMEIEFKLEYPTRNLLLKQARPHAIGGFEVPNDCRDF